MHRRYDAINVPIELLRTLVAIDDLKSVSKAAEALNLTQPAISAQIKRLEKLVGAEVRSKGEAFPQITQTGETVVRYARRILSLNDQILLYARTKSAPKTCRIGMSMVYAGAPLKDLLGLLRNAKPTEGHEFGFGLTIGDSPEIARQLTAGHVDFAILPAELRGDFTSHGEWEEKVLWLCAKDLLHSPGKPIPLIGWTSGVFHRLMIEALDRSNVAYTINFSANDWSSRLAAARAGLGYIATIQRNVEPDLKNAKEYFLPPLPELKVGIYSAETFDSARVQPYLGALTEYFATSPVI